MSKRGRKPGLNAERDAEIAGLLRLGHSPKDVELEFGLKRNRILQIAAAQGVEFPKNVCASCGGKFDAKTVRAKYCSTRCRDAKQTEKYMKRTVEVNCAGCGKPFFLPKLYLSKKNADGTPRREFYCSRKCSGTAKRRS